MSRTVPKMLLAVSLASVLAACGTVAQSPAPQALTPGLTPAHFDAQAPADATVWPAADWWTGFGSPELDQLIAVAQAGNLDLAAAAARVLQAESQTKISSAALYPTLDLQGSAERSRTAINGPSGTRTVTSSAFGLSLDAAYQLDLFGKARAGVRAAEESALASRYARQTVALTVTSDVANTYFDVLALRQRLAIARGNVDDARRILAVVQSRVRNGEASPLDLAQQEAQVRSLAAAVPPLEEQAREARNALAILLGRPPEGFDVAAASLDGLARPDVAPGLPSDLLLRRPDVAQAEANLASAHANVEAARAAFFPDIGLTASGSLNPARIANLFSPASLGWTLGSSLAQTIFDGGQRKGQLALSQAREEELVANYRSAVINAFSDVEQALGQGVSFGQEETERVAQTESAATALGLAEKQYRAGAIDLTTLLTTEQALFTAQDQLAQVRLAQLQSKVSLYQALGGGWSAPARLAAKSATVTGAP
jgi:NodT family efflux transporter outer membrane factor (OMF) lipoprotein